MMWLTTILITTLILLLIKWVRDRRYRQQTIQRMGLPGPEPSLLLGCLAETKGIHESRQRPLYAWSKKYGKTFGYYEGARPMVVTSDPEIIQHVLIKNFSGFHSRKPSFLSPSKESLDIARGEKWKRLRMILSPSFSARCMKEMSPMVNESVTNFLKVLQERAKEGKSFNIMKDFQGLTMSTIAACGFGLDIDAIDNPDNVFLKKCQAIFNMLDGKNFLFRYTVPLVFVAPGILRLLQMISHDTFALPNRWFFDTAGKIIEQRKANKTLKLKERKDKKKKKDKSRRDFIQLMLEAEDKGTPSVLKHLEVAVDDDMTEKPNPTTNLPLSTGRGKGMTLSEMQSQCMTFLLAGYETTSTALSFAAYELAVNPDVQRLLQEEIDDHLPQGKLPDYLSVQKMQYMDRFFSEVLRLHVIAEVVNTRECFEDITVGDLHIARGTCVQIHVEAVHKDPDLWGPEDPELFVPDRFLPERKAARHPMAWLPFGGGPRNCIGMRFALMEAKITLARMLKTYTIVKAEEQKVPLPETTFGIYKPSEGVFVKLNTR